MKTDHPPGIRLSPSDSSLDAWLLFKYGRRLPWIESQISNLDEAEENRRTLETWLKDLRTAHEAGNVELRILAIDRLLLGLKATKQWIPLSAVGAKFIAGRKPGAAGRVRRAIAAHLKQHPNAKNPEIWEALRSKPPKGWCFYANRLGEYIEHQDGETKRAQFNNICGEERRKIRR